MPYSTEKPFVPDDRRYWDIRKRRARVAPPTTSVCWSWDFETWEPNFRHWEAPSSFTVFSDASFRFKVARMASGFRWQGHYQDGPSWRYSLGVILLNEGIVIRKLGFHIATLPYRGQAYDLNVAIRHPELLSCIDRASHARVVQIIEQEKSEDFEDWVTFDQI